MNSYTPIALKRFFAYWFLMYLTMYVVNFGLYILASAGIHSIFSWLLLFASPTFFFLGGFFYSKSLPHRWAGWLWTGVIWVVLSIIVSALLMPTVYGVSSSIGLSIGVWKGGVINVVMVILGSLVQDRLLHRAEAQKLSTRS